MSSSCLELEEAKIILLYVHAVHAFFLYTSDVCY